VSRLALRAETAVSTPSPQLVGEKGATERGDWVMSLMATTPAVAAASRITVAICHTPRLVGRVKEPPPIGVTVLYSAPVD
jgi:hypothetical protein